LPRLLYVKAPASDREPRLADLLARIQGEAAASYRHFRTPAELGRLVRDDLAVLVSERFAAGGQGAAAESAAGGRIARPLPVSMTSLLGRERAIDEALAGGRRRCVVPGLKANHRRRPRQLGPGLQIQRGGGLATLAAPCPRFGEPKREPPQAAASGLDRSGR
jgi:hypothetical protein